MKWYGPASAKRCYHSIAYWQLRVAQRTARAQWLKKKERDRERIVCFLSKRKKKVLEFNPLAWSYVTYYFQATVKSLQVSKLIILNWCSLSFPPAALSPHACPSTHEPSPETLWWMTCQWAEGGLREFLSASQLRKRETWIIIIMWKNNYSVWNKISLLSVLDA